MGLFDKNKKPLIQKKKNDIIESNEQNVFDNDIEVDDSFDVVSLFNGSYLDSPDIDLEAPEEIIYENKSLINMVPPVIEKEQNKNIDDCLEQVTVEEIIKEPSEEPINNFIKPSKSSLFEKKKSLNLNKKEILQKMEEPKLSLIKEFQEKQNNSTFIAIDENTSKSFSSLNQTIEDESLNINKLEDTVTSDDKIEKPIEETFLDNDIEIDNSFDIVNLFGANNSNMEALNETSISDSSNLSEADILSKEEINVSNLMETFEESNDIFEEQESNSLNLLDNKQNYVEKEVKTNNETVELENTNISIETQETQTKEDSFDTLFSLFDYLQENKENNSLENFSIEEHSDENENIEIKEQEKQEGLTSLFQENNIFEISEQKKSKEDIYSEDKVTESINDEFDLFEQNKSNSILDVLLGQFSKSDEKNNLESSDKSILENKQASFSEVYEIDEDEINRQEELLDNQIIKEINDAIEDNKNKLDLEEFENLQIQKEETLDDLLDEQKSTKLEKTLDNLETETNYLKAKRKGLLKYSSLTDSLKESIKKEVQEITEEEDSQLLKKDSFISIDEQIDENLFKEKQTDYSKLNEAFNPYIGKTTKEIEELRIKNQEALEIRKNEENLESLKELSNSSTDIVTEINIEAKSKTEINEYKDELFLSLIEEDYNKEEELKKQKEELAKAQYTESLKTISAELKVIKEDIETIDFAIFQDFSELIYNYRKLRKEYLDNKKRKEEQKRKLEKEKREREQQSLLAQKQALLEEQLIMQGYSNFRPTLIGNVSENSREKLMRLRATAKDIPDEEETFYGVKVNNRDILLSELNERLPRKALYDEFIDDSYEESPEEFISPSKDTFSHHSIRPPERRKL